MKSFLFSAGLLCACCYLHCQDNFRSRGEFATNPNGLMYSDADMKVLRHIVDSLNIRYKTCDLSANYYSQPQARAFYISYKSKSNDLHVIRQDIKRGIPFDSLIKKYARYQNEIDEDLIFVRGRSRDDDDLYYYLKGKPGEGYDRASPGKEFTQKDRFPRGWITDYTKKGEYSDYYELDCYFFPDPFKSKSIPVQYGRYIQYVDCMIDTNAQIFLTDKYRGAWYFEDDQKKGYHNLKNMSAFLSARMNTKPADKNPSRLSNIEIEYAVKNLAGDPAFRKIVEETIADYVQHKKPDYQLESLANDLGMYDKALLMKRSYRVMGMCSQDQSPRIHALQIARLSAQARSWDIFLRAHLDIMNDRFERMSDGSYAYGERKTYLKELEELNLNIVDLMLGLSLRSDNVANNHYYGTIWRLGWALTESKERARFEEQAIGMMKNPELDEFNRGLLFLLYTSYIYRLENIEEANLKIAVIKKQFDKFPESMHGGIAQLKERVKKSEEKE